ncbi:SCP-like protein [Necator americanus]|uniref:SCP-like protein n=1 Tax=Necator americanus TaxID=51031 RepID=W2T0C2_NECAM|nr:SCP-like protein [Necator americanus]ETN74412.1 SCP-like protein [Necator americanus]
MFSTDRHVFLDFHNDGRQRVASGIEPSVIGGFLPAASNMYKLRWSCLLENEMHERLSKCPAEVPPLKGFGQNVMILYEREGTSTIPLKEVRETLREWWSELNINEDVESIPWYTDEDHHNFANMIFAKNTEIGCSYASCEEDERILIGCLYRKK